MTQSTKKRTWDPQAKLEIVKSHLVGGKAVSVICEEHEITPSLYYKWQSTLFENGAESLCLLYTSPSPRDLSTSRMPSSA